MTAPLRISLLHIAPVPGNLLYNRRLLAQAIKRAAEKGADWAVSPELAVSGYQFSRLVGTDWIAPQPDSWMREFCQLVNRLQITVFVGGPERDRQTDKLYNSVFLINSTGELLGKHRKINTRPDLWATPGETILPIQWQTLKVGLLICADAYTRQVTETLKRQGTQILVSSAAWGPGLHGPEGEWEQRTRETGLPLIVCNRTGKEETLDFMQAESLVIKDGRRLLAYRSDRSVVLTFDWDVDTMCPLSSEFQRDYL